ncbi:MAG TPA: response regulator [Methylomirabilota bacterium]|nr:response regulator [Methylomirabilota bacterium]
MKKILVIEDDPIIAHIYRTRFEREGYQVEISADGQTGFYRIHEFRPDAVLLDLMLPKMNGIDILKKIRAQGQFGKVPVIVFTNAYVPNMIQEAFGAGATQVFNKATLTPRQILDAMHIAIHGGTPPVEAPAEPASPPPSPPATIAAMPAIVPPLPSTRSADTEFVGELRKTFRDSIPDTISTLRKLLQDFSKTTDETGRLSHLLELFRKVHSLTGNAGLAGLPHVAQLTAALEVLLKELHEKPKNINLSTLRTVAAAIDFLAELLRLPDAEIGDQGPYKILVVDDEILSRRAITYALEKAALQATNVEDPQVALSLAAESAFDLIFLDVQMPGMDGFDLCTKIRQSPLNKTTPVVFVTSLTDLKSRARSTLSGGTDLIAKPFMFIELSVKALTYVIRGRFLKKPLAVAA